MKWSNQSYYEGDWIEGKACGKGKFVFPDHSVYEGSFFDNFANGYGTFTLKNCTY
jgi:1-phosphatidylinositol-4-phosphate 5-kinase